ncbi:MAG TPA: amino acid adenylation domain-containing protein [Streptosporangiaceae bacterium]|nr:amino acid adenylation domain-containing protein [Streptosporangiaceae bacterium]
MAEYEFPTSFGQRQMWLLAELDCAEPTYNIAWALWLDGQLEVSALQRAWAEALIRHEALRTTFRNESGVPVQVIEDEPAERPLEVTSVEQLGDGEREQAALARIQQLARAPFNLAAGPLARGLLVRLSPEAHVLAVVMHHIVADGWSFRILFDELAADYEAISAGGAPVAGEPPIQYADYAIWQTEHAEEGGYGPAERFWRTELAGAPPTMPLPADRPYPANQTFACDWVDCAIDASLADALRKVAAQHGTTLFAVLLAAYAVVLARMTGSDDLLIAVPMAARTRPETERVVGLFMNTVTIRVRVGGDETLSDLVRSVHSATVRSMAHQELQFARVVELIRPERDPARLPLLQVSFAMEEPWTVPDRGGLRWRPELLETGTVKFEIELAVTESPSGPQARVRYNTNLFDAATGELVAGGFMAILRQLSDDPDVVAGDAEIMSADEYAEVTREWPDGGPAVEPDATAAGLLWQACASDAVVVAGTDAALTGNDVRDLALRIAAALRGHGAGVSDRVAILVSRGARILPVMLGIWSAGASCVPLDPIYPDKRLAAMLDDSGAVAIVIDSGAEDAPAVPSSTVPIAVVDLAALPAGTGNLSAPVDLPPSATAVTIFTSGSTGRPKAVNVSQGNLATLLNATRPLLALGPDDLLVAVSTFTFDIAELELILPVLTRGRVVVADADQALDAMRLRELLIGSGATALQATPATWRMLTEAGGVPDTVRLRISGGEALPRDLADAIGTGPDVRLLNLYGPTETTIYSGGDAVSPSPAPIEIAANIAGDQLYVLDDRRRPVPPGVIGEIYIGGAGVTHGYLGAPGLTAGKFIPDPFSGRPGARLYRTGDVGRWRRSGRIELAGRADRQIKIRGYRIESGEIENALRADDDIVEAVVSVRGSGHDLRLVGYLVTRSGAGQPPEGLHERLREVLPDYMVPLAFVVLPSLPLTASGKIDHRALPEPDWAALSGQVKIPPRTPVECKLAEIFAELLALPEPAGVRDNFFALGGHSLTATQLMARIRVAYGVDLPVRTLFGDPTVAGLAVALAGAGIPAQARTLVPSEVR